MPRVEDHLLSDEVAVLARDCHFDRGIIAPLMTDQSMAVELPVTPRRCFTTTTAKSGFRGWIVSRRCSRQSRKINETIHLHAKPR